jgi:hypothetical protein
MNYHAFKVGDTEPVEFVDEGNANGSTSACWIPAIILATWIEFAYAVPAISHWLSQFLIEYKAL